MSKIDNENRDSPISPKDKKALVDLLRWLIVKNFDDVVVDISEPDLSGDFKLKIRGYNCAGNSLNCTVTVTSE